MKKLIICLCMVFAIVVCKKAAAIEITYPMETGATAFWFPSSGTFAMGVSHTVLRATMPDVIAPVLGHITIDLDATLAKEITQEINDLYGLGIKATTDRFSVPISDSVTVLPTLGVTALNNFKEKVFRFKVALYGTLIQYKWK